MNKRLLWADIVRIIAIYFIVALHVVKFPGSLSSNFIFFIDQALIHTCVPLFVMLSGALLLGKEESYQTFFKKRIVRVLFPWITWTIVFTFMAIIYQNNFNFQNILHTFHLLFFPFFWFIPLIFGLYLLTPALRIFVQNAKVKDIALVIAIWYIAVSLLPYIRNTEAFPLSVDNGVVTLVSKYIGYFLLGYLIVKIKLSRKYLPALVLFFVCNVLVISAISYFQTVYNGGKFAGIFYDYRAPGIILATASLFSIIYLFEDFLQHAIHPRFKKLIISLSSASFGIYFFHYIFLNHPPLPTLIKSTNLVMINPAIDLFINGIIFFTVSYIVIFILQKIPLAKRFIG